MRPLHGSKKAVRNVRARGFSSRWSLCTRVSAQTLDSKSCLGASASLTELKEAPFVLRTL